MQISLLAPPSGEPVSLADAKLAARVDGTAFDSIIPGLISSARRIAQQETGLLFGSQTWRIEAADWPLSTDVLPIYRPTALAVTYWNGTTYATLSAPSYVFGVVDCGFSLAAALNTSLPALADIAVGPRVRIDATAGETADECVKTYIKAMVAFWLRNPEAAQAGNLQAAPFLSNLLDPVRTFA